MEIDQLWLALLGTAIVLVALFDLAVTTVAVSSGAGPVTRLVARLVTAAAHVGPGSHQQLRRAGVAGALAVPAVWVGMVLLGFTLMFLADDDAVLVASSQQPAAALGRLAYAAGGLAGAGASLVAGTETWELVNNVAAIVGLGMMTLALTYLFQVVTSVKAERTTSSLVAALGPSAEEVVAGALRSPGLGTLPGQLVDIAAAISSAAQGHLALPMLRFFHSADRGTAVSIALARYDDVLTILEEALPEAHVPTVRSGRAAVEMFLGTVELSGPDAPGPPPPPPIAALRTLRDDLPDDATFADRCRRHADRRRRLLAYVRQERWSWNDVIGTDGGRTGSS